MAEFTSGGHVVVHRNSHPGDPIEVNGTYKTDDKSEIEALRAQPGIEEVKSSSKKSSD